MNITEQEKEQLFEEFKNRVLDEMKLNTKSAAYRNQNNLKRARDHFGARAEKIRKNFEFEIWSNNGLNWPDWEIVRKMIYHTYGVSTASAIADESLEEVNNFTIELIDKLFDINEKTLRRMKCSMELENRLEGEK